MIQMKKRDSALDLISCSKTSIFGGQNTLLFDGCFLSVGSQTYKSSGMKLQDEVISVLIKF